MSRNKDLLFQLAVRTRPQSAQLCRTCLSARRQNSTAAAAATSSSIPDSDPAQPSDFDDTTPPSPAPSSSPSKTHIIKAGVLLSRPPMLTRDLTPFEKAYFLYQKRLNERLVLPFTRYFYYQRNTPAEVEWKRKVRERTTPARDIGAYSGYGPEAWHDEVLVGSEIGEPDVQRELLVKDSEVEVKRRNEQGEEEVTKEEAERPMPRWTEADESNDTRSLNRALTRTVYLLVKNKGSRHPHGEWSFPCSELLLDESLHKAARRIIAQTSGSTIHTWVVGKVPIGHQIHNYAQVQIDKESNSETRGEKTFFMKARAMAGKVNLQNNVLGALDYQWLAKDEIQKTLSPFDWAAVKNILAER